MTLSKRPREEDSSPPSKHPKNEPASPALDISGALGLLPGSKLQVLWHLADSDEEDEASESVWWDCTLLPSTGEVHELLDEEAESCSESWDGGADDGNGARVSATPPESTTASPPHSPIEKRVRVKVHVLRYAARPPEFPETEDIRVVFGSANTLLDIENDATMEWRHQCEAVRAADIEVGDTANPLEDDEVTGTVESVVQSTMQNVLQRVWPAMHKRADAASQRRVASVMREAGEHVKAAFHARLREKTEQGALTNVITVADTRLVLESIAPSLLELRNSLRDGTDAEILASGS